MPGRVAAPNRLKPQSSHRAVLIGVAAACLWASTAASIAARSSTRTDSPEHAVHHPVSMQRTPTTSGVLAERTPEASAPASFDTLVAPLEHPNISRHVVGSVVGVAAGEGDQAIYHNSSDELALPLAPGLLVADDVELAALSACEITAYAVTVSGEGDGSGPGFDTQVALYDDCPSHGGAVLPGTDMTVALPDDGIHEIHINLDTPFLAGPHLWVGVTFPDGGAWYVGAPPDVGWSANVFDYPGWSCDAKLTPAFASFAATVYGTCDQPAAAAPFTMYRQDAADAYWASCDAGACGNDWGMWYELALPEHPGVYGITRIENVGILNDTLQTIEQAAILIEAYDQVFFDCGFEPDPQSTSIHTGYLGGALLLFGELQQDEVATASFATPEGSVFFVAGQDETVFISVRAGEIVNGAFVGRPSLGLPAGAAPADIGYADSIRNFDTDGDRTYEEGEMSFIDVGHLTITLHGDVFADCNHNNIRDLDELACAAGDPSNCDAATCALFGPGNGGPIEDPLGIGYIVPSACDDNEDGLPDACTADCNGDGILDIDEVAADPGNDCNRNGIPDDCDIDNDPSLDTDANDVIDACLLYVDADATGRDDGSSWADAYDDLYVALLAAHADPAVREIWVAEGVYTPSDAGHRFLSFQLAPGVAVYGGFSGMERHRKHRNPRQYVTVLSGDLERNDDPDAPATFGDCCRAHGTAGCEVTLCAQAVCEWQNSCCTEEWDQSCADLADYVCNGCPNDTYADNSYHVIQATSVDEPMLLDGFTITGGRAVLSSFVDYVGGAIFLLDAIVHIRDCRFVGNAGLFGGAVYDSANCARREPCTFERCTFDNNHAWRHGGAGYHIGGFYPFDVSFIDCRFTGNTANDDGGALSLDYLGEATFEGCTLAGNVAGYAGGGLRYDGPRLDITRSRITGNTATFGGGVSADSREMTVSDSLLAGNEATERGGAMSVTGLRLWGSTVALNTAAEGAAAQVHASGHPKEIRNSVVWDNDSTDGGPQFGGVPASVAYSIIDNGTGDGVVYEDPLFVDPAGPDGIIGTDDDDFRLMPGSPAIDAGNQDLPPSGPRDLDGHARVLCGQIDLGAHESGIGDDNCDGILDLADFAAWPPCMTAPHEASGIEVCQPFDHDGDLDVDLRDFAGFTRAF